MSHVFVLVHLLNVLSWLLNHVYEVLIKKNVRNTLNTDFIADS